MGKKLYQRVSRMLGRREINRPDTATVYEKDGDHVDIRIGSSSNLLRYVAVVGDPDSIEIGDQVNIRWEQKDGGSGYKPVVLTQASAAGSARTYSETFPDNITIEYSPIGLRVKAGSLNFSHLSFTPAIEGHVHADSLNAHGWQIDDSGTIFSQATFIHRDGQISLGIHPNIVKLDALHATYRIWAGDADPTLAPFSVSKAGAIRATSGEIGGWAIATDTLSSDSGNAFINSSVPSIGLGATGYEAGTGFWVGLHTIVDGVQSTAYKLFLGNAASQYLTWDGTALQIAGSVQSTDFNSGISGWSIDADGDAELNNVIIRGTLHATVFEYGTIHSTAGTLGIFKSAGKVHTGFTTPAVEGVQFTFQVTNRDASVPPFTVGDKLRVQIYSGGNIIGFWANVTSQVVSTDYTEITTVGWSGSTNTYFPEGTAIADYGTDGTGFITLSVDGTIGHTPNMTMAVIDSSLPPNQTIYTRIGNLRNSYGYGDTDIYGAALGKYASDSTFITIDPSNGIRIIERTIGDTVVARWDKDGNITIGQAAQSNAYITSTSFSMRDGSVKRVELTSAGILYINDSDGNAVFTLDASAGAEFTKSLTLGTSGGVYQGTGTFASPTTGLKLWNDSGVGRIAGYNSGTIQWYGDTDGKLYAGAGVVTLSSAGLRIQATSEDPESTARELTFMAGSNRAGGISALYDGLGTEMYITNNGGSPGATTHLIRIKSVTGIKIVTGTFYTTYDAYFPSLAQSGFSVLGGGISASYGSNTYVPGGEIYAASRIYVNETANANMAIGLTINQGTNTNELFALKGSDIAHSFATQTEPDTFFEIKKAGGAYGGALISGYGESNYAGLKFMSHTETETTTRTSGGVIVLDVYRSDGGTSRTPLSSDANGVILRNGSSNKVVFTGGGDMWFAGTLYKYNGSSQYEVYGYHPLTTPVLSSFFNGTARATTARVQRTATSASDWSSNIPSGARAIRLRIVLKDSASDGKTTTCWVLMGESSSNNTGSGCKCNGITNSAETENEIVVPLDSSGRFYWQCTSGAGAATLSIYAFLQGYYI